MTMLERSILWVAAPPTKTAYFSTRRKPERVEMKRKRDTRSGLSSSTNGTVPALGTDELDHLVGLADR